MLTNIKSMKELYRDAKEITNDLGDDISIYKEGTHPIICEIDEKDLDKLLEDNNYVFDPKGDQENVIYVIRDYKFEKRLHINTKASVALINCLSIDGIKAINADMLYLEDNYYFFLHPEELDGEEFITTKNVNSIILCNDNMKNRNISKNLNIDVFLNAKRIFMENSRIKTKKGKVNITAKETKFINSDVEADDVTLNLEEKPKSDKESTITSKTLHWFGEMGSKVELDFKKFDRQKEVSKTLKK